MEDMPKDEKKEEEKKEDNPCPPTYKWDEESKNEFILPSEENISDALEGLPVILPELGDKTSALIKLNNLIDTYLYISRNIDPEILNYINEKEEAVIFYYT